MTSSRMQLTAFNAIAFFSVTANYTRMFCSIFLYQIIKANGDGCRRPRSTSQRGEGSSSNARARPRALSRPTMVMKYWSDLLDCDSE